ncbi:MAG: hypothetical protein QM820_62810 [Minicystis sp.]
MSFPLLFGQVVTTAAELAVILVAATVVRRARPDAWGFLATGAAMHIFATFSFPFFNNVAARIAVLGTLSTVYAAVGVLVALIRAIGWALVAAGLFRISTTTPPPARPDR